MQYVFIILMSFFFIGCSVEKDIQIKDINVSEPEVVIHDLVNIPQNVKEYTDGIENKELYDTQNEYEKSYFSMWNIKKASQTLEDIQWPFRYFDTTQSYGENLLPIKKEFLDEMYKESNFDEYSTLNKKALTLKYSNIRALPTTKPLLKDPKLAGEGFPFDYLQNSSVNANTPIFVSHYSKDKQWVYIFSSFANGWLKSNEVVFIDDEYATLWQNAKQILITKEGEPLFSISGESLFDTRIGMMFALIDEKINTYTILTVSAYKNSKPMFNMSTISKHIATKEILKLNETNLNKIVKEVSKTNYGWGGVYEQRDCSSMLMDMYVPFGIWLPRNSSNQSKMGEVIDLKNLSDSDKIKIIKEKAVPFETLLYKKGHIVLYVGIYNNEVIVFHNTWGIKTKDGEKEGRFIVGKAIFSTLRLGDELKNYDKDAELLKNIESMNTITR